MRRVLGVVVVLAIAIFPTSLSAQRGGARVGSAGGHPITSVGGISASRGPANFGRGGFHEGFHAGPVGRFTRPVLIAPFGYGYYPGFYSPFFSSVYAPYSYPYDPSAGYTYTAPAYEAPAYTAPPVAVQDNSAELAYQVGALSAQVAELRAEQARGVPPAAVAGSSNHVGTQTVLVFRDGRRQEIQNYAIVGQTLWIFDERSSSRIPLSDLDLTATQNENRQRGVRFTVPGK